MIENNIDSATWNETLATFPSPPILQTWQWGEVKQHYGWQAEHLFWKNDQNQITALALVLIRTLSWRGVNPDWKVIYIPRGPIVRDWSDSKTRIEVIRDIQAFARQKKAIFVKMDPELEVARGVPGEVSFQENPPAPFILSEIKELGWQFSPEQIQFRNTVVLDLSPSENDLLARMKQKTRYNIRLAGRQGVSVRVGTSSDFDLLYQMYADTSLRDGFVIRERAYYFHVWDTFLRAGMALPLISEVDGNPIAGLWLFKFAGKAWFLYGMSTDSHREKMPSYKLQWEAIRAAKSAGCMSYDLWGAPDQFNQQDKLWGVYKFKDGFGGQVIQYLGAWDFPVRPTIYRVYTQVIPRILAIMRLRGKFQIQSSLSAGSI